MRKLKEIDITKINFDNMTPSKFRKLNERFEKLLSQQNTEIENLLRGTDITKERLKEFKHMERIGELDFKRTYNCPCGSKKEHQFCCYKPIY